MGLADRVAQDGRIGRRNVIIKWVTLSAVGLASLLFVLFYYLLPMWRG